MQSSPMRSTVRCLTRRASASFSTPSPCRSIGALLPPTRTGASISISLSTIPASSAEVANLPPPSIMTEVISRRPNSRSKAGRDTPPSPGGSTVTSAPCSSSVRRRAREIRGEAAPAVDDYPQRIAPLLPTQPGREHRVISQDRPDADNDRIHHVAELVDPTPGLFAGDPLRVTGPRGELAVQAHRGLEDDQRFPGPNVFEVRLIQSNGLFLEQAHLDRDPGLSKSLHATACYGRVRVVRGGDHLYHSGLNQGVGARRSPPVMGTRLEGDTARRSRGRCSGCLEGDHLGMVTPESSMEPFPDDHVVAHQDGPDHGIWARPSPSPRGEREGAFHVSLMYFGHRRPVTGRFFRNFCPS